MSCSIYQERCGDRDPQNEQRNAGRSQRKHIEQSLHSQSVPRLVWLDNPDRVVLDYPLGEYFLLQPRDT